MEGEQFKRHEVGVTSNDKIFISNVIKIPAVVRELKHPN
jgi:hypothetical protein